MTDNNSDAAERYECGALVVGSGAAGLSAVVTAGHHGLDWSKEPRFGGTSARSGCWVWIFGPSPAKAWGIVETPDQVRSYLKA